MTNSNPTLTQEILLNEYINWVEKFKMSKNDSDLRFGQYIHNNYHVSQKLQTPDGFYTENPYIAFNQLSQLSKNYH